MHTITTMLEDRAAQRRAHIRSEAAATIITMICVALGLAIGALAFASVSAKGIANLAAENLRIDQINAAAPW